METTHEQLSHLNNVDLFTLRKKIDDIMRVRGIKYDYSIPLKLIRKRLNSENTGIFKSEDYKTCGLISEDWDYLFPGDYDTSKNYYVYYHCNPSKSNTGFSTGDYKIKFAGLPFYIGKGKDNRYLSLDRHEGHLNLLKRLIGRGFSIEDIAHILANNLTEKEALILESKLIVYLGSKWAVLDDEIWHSKLRGGLLINSNIPPHPDKYDDTIIKEVQ